MCGLAPIGVDATNDVEALAPGEGCYAALLDHKGKLRADMRILRGAESWLIDTEPIGLVPVRHTVQTYSLGRDVHFEDVRFGYGDDRRRHCAPTGAGHNLREESCAAWASRGRPYGAHCGV